jgi:hypothetical protein
MEEEKINAIDGGKNMIKSKLLKAIALGLTMSALYTGAAFAGQIDGGTSPAYEGQVIDPETSALYDKQLEIDRYLFADHSKETEQLNFKIVYTGVVEDKVEIGITPYSDENADYLYQIFGSESVEVIESDESILYTTMDIAPVSELVDPIDPSLNEDIYTLYGAADSAVTDDVAVNTAVSDTDMEPVSEEDKVTIQIESFEGDETAVDDSSIYETVSAPADNNIKTVAANDNGAIAEGNIVKDTDKADGLSTPILVLIIAAGAAFIGGTVLIALRKKAVK